MPKDERGYFEDFLREQTDGFRLQPPARVWTSIYNNYHPGKKWPAFSTLFLFIVSLQFLHTHSATEQMNGDKATRNVIIVNTKADKKYHPAESQQISNKSNNASTNILPQASLPNLKKSQDKSPEISNESHQSAQIAPLALESLLASTEQTQHIPETKAFESTASMINSTKFYQPEIDNNNDDLNTKALTSRTSNSDEGNLSYQIYATPSYGYRTFGMNQEVENPEYNKANATAQQSETNNLIRNFNQYSTWNIEAGGALLWNINRMIRIKAGMQLNYSNYSIQENPTCQSISPSTFNSNTLNTNIDDDINYNSSYQISMPMGTEFELTGNTIFQWYAGATIQPSYLFGSNSLMVHSDLKNIMQDPNMIRRWNVNTSFETYMSYRLSNGIIINAGPQFRYQLLSSFDRSFIYSEKLYNLGMKLGISKYF